MTLLLQELDDIRNELDGLVHAVQHQPMAKSERDRKRVRIAKLECVQNIYYEQCRDKFRRAMHCDETLDSVVEDERVQGIPISIARQLQ